MLLQKCITGDQFAFPGSLKRITQDVLGPCIDYPIHSVAGDLHKNLFKDGSKSVWLLGVLAFFIKGIL